MSGVTRLIVVRHGNTFNAGDVILRVGGATDLPLTEKGLLQGAAVGRALRDSGYQVDEICYAPLLRTKQSAEGVGQSFPDAAMCPEEFLTELDYGQDDGQPEADVVLRLGIAAMREQITPQVTLDALREAGKAALGAWDAEAVLPAGWECLSDRVARLPGQWRSFASRWLARHPGGTVAAVTSNGIARFSRALLPDGQAPEGSLKLSTGAFGVYEYDGECWRCAAWNVRPAL